MTKNYTYFLTSYTKIKLRWITDCKRIQVVLNHHIYKYCFESGKDLLSQARAKISKCDYLKLNSFFTAKKKKKSTKEKASITNRKRFQQIYLTIG